MGFEDFFMGNSWILSLIMLLIIPIKGYALWISARKGQKWWFIALLVVNSLAILELVYLFAIAKIHEQWREKSSKRKAALPEAPKSSDAPKAE